MLENNNVNFSLSISVVKINWLYNILLTFFFSIYTYILNTDYKFIYFIIYFVLQIFCIILLFLKKLPNDFLVLGLSSLITVSYFFLTEIYINKAYLIVFITYLFSLILTLILSKSGIKKKTAGILILAFLLYLYILFFGDKTMIDTNEKKALYLLYFIPLIITNLMIINIKYLQSYTEKRDIKSNFTYKLYPLQGYLGICQIIFLLLYFFSIYCTFIYSRLIFSIIFLLGYTILFSIICFVLEPKMNKNWKKSKPHKIIMMIAIVLFIVNICLLKSYNVYEVFIYTIVNFGFLYTLKYSWF